jgi:hypothetical protein
MNRVTMTWVTTTWMIIELALYNLILAICLDETQQGTSQTTMSIAAILDTDSPCYQILSRALQAPS